MARERGVAGCRGLVSHCPGLVFAPMLLLLASMVGSTGLASGSSLLPVGVERWDFTREWVPILEDAARFSLQSGALPHGRMDVAKLHHADCRVASTVRYDVDVGLGEAAGDVSASFYDPPIQCCRSIADED